MRQIPPKTAFFDIGGTLGDVIVSEPDGSVLRLEVYSGVRETLEELKANRVRIGVISQIGMHPPARVDRMLEEAALLDFFVPAPGSVDLRVYLSGTVRKDEAAFREALRQAGHAATPQECVFVGESAAERQEATRAGMRVTDRPRLALDVLLGLQLGKSNYKKEEDMENKDTLDTLSNTLQALTQATQALTVAATQMMQTMQGMARGAPPSRRAQPAQINTWEDDPFSEAIPTTNPVSPATVSVNVPDLNAQPLPVRIVEQQPAPSRHASGTAEFRYWTAAEALTRGIGFWTPLLPMGTRWSTSNPILQVTLVAPGEQLNAFYSRFAGLRFFQATVRSNGRRVTIFSGESPNVVCHELGHAILDALRPQLFNAASLEADAFHEAFGDMSSILSALELPTLRDKVLNETQGNLNVNSRLSRLAEQMGWGIRQLSPTAVDSDCLRNAANRFLYQQPERLPSEGPASQLTSEAHSFARVFVGAFLDAFDGMLTVTGAANDANLLTVSRDLGRLLVDGIQNTPITPAYFSQVAAAMIQADSVRSNGQYRNALSTAFIGRGILSPAAVATLANAPLPHVQAVPPPPAGIVGMVGTVGAGGFASATGAPTLLTYNDGADDDGYQRGFTDAPELPLHTVSDPFGLNIQLLVHAPTENERFAVAPAAIDTGSVERPNPEYTALCFIEDLMRRGRLDLGSARGIIPELSTLTGNKTHKLEDTPEGLVLKRLYFDCGFHGRH